MVEIWHNTYFTVGVAFVIFLAILWYFGVPKLVTGALDNRGTRIRAELDEARKLREEAQALFADFENRQKQVSGQADEIVAHARTEAEQAAKRAKADLEVSIERRLKAADEQIEQAEADAMRRVRDRAISVAIAAATDVLGKHVDAERQGKLVDEAIEDLGSRLH